MKTKTTYSCEICGHTSEDRRIVFECENQAKPMEYPQGMLYGDNRKGAFYEHICLCVESNYIRGHSNHVSNWACREADFYRVGDSLGSNTCGSGNDIWKDDNHLNMQADATLRMIKYLNDNKIPVTVWDGKKPVGLQEYLELI